MTTQPTNPATYLRSLRRLTPQKPITTIAEAKHIAELQASRLRHLFNAQLPRFDTGLIQTIPRIQISYKSAHTTARTAWNGTHWLIQLNGTQPTVQQRFALLRELKHIIDIPALSTTYARIRSRIDRHQVDYLCDHFAAHTLMPAETVKQLWTDGNHNPRSLANIFDVSHADMSRHLQRIGIIDQTRPPNKRPHLDNHRAANHRPEQPHPTQKTCNHKMAS